ncbi:MAG: biotin/lipoyl-binding protein, partial [Candidatus Sulfotelmatobacter sp.]
MRVDNEQKPEHRQSDRGSSGQGQNPHPHPAHGTKRNVDEEIKAMEEQSRHQTATLQPPPEIPPVPPRRALMVVGVALLVLLAAGAITLITRASHERALAKETELETVPTVAIVHPLAEKPDEELVLPGSLLAFEESPIYARTNGYLVRWYRDIGSRVKEGELLADIDTPEVDQELNQSRAARQQIVAQLELAKISAERWENLRKTDSVSAQEADQQTSGYKQAQANLVAADANVKRLEQLEGFKRVYAPFSGVLTKRNVDP